MGGSNGVPLPRYSCCIRQQNPNRCKENHTFTPKIKGHKRNLSAAFNMADLDTDFNVDFMDVNRASEEELMTLPGINRQTAHNIVDYRKQIGGFKKVEDLALVSGVGATKLDVIRLEITVGRKKTSLNSSPNSSKVDLSIPDDVSRGSVKNGSYQKVDVNSANVFLLMKVKGLTQSLAENIVAYRDKHGSFRKLDDLVKVKGIKPALLSAVRHFLIIGSSGTHNGVDPNGHYQKNIPSHKYLPNGHVNGPTRLAGGDNLGSDEDFLSLYGPLARKSFRSKKRPVNFFRKNNRQMVRISSWNLDNCDSQKVTNPGVREVFAMTILENGLSIVCLQGLRDNSVLEKLCAELNSPTIPNVKKWPGHQGSWRAVTSNKISGQSPAHVGFIYDVSRGIECKPPVNIKQCINSGKQLDIEPCQVVFKVKDWEVSIVCIDWEPNQPNTILEDVLEAISEQTEDNRDVIITGSFHMSPAEQPLDLLRNKDYKSVLKADQFTDISSKNLEGTVSNCTIWIKPTTYCLYSHNYDVIRDGLTSPWIPDGWGWGGYPSSYCPIWAEFYVDASCDRGDNIRIKPDDTDDEDFVDALEDAPHS